LSFRHLLLHNVLQARNEKPERVGRMKFHVSGESDKIRRTQLFVLSLSVVTGAPTPEELVQTAVNSGSEELNVRKLVTGACSNLAETYSHTNRQVSGGRTSHGTDEEQSDVPKTVLNVLEDFRECLVQLRDLRDRTLQAGQESAEWNKKAYMQYRDVVDQANDLDLNVTLEEAMAKQRRRESAILLKEMRNVENKRRNLFAPLWQSVGLWDGFKPDPRMDAESRDLPYVGGEARRESTVERLLGQLNSQQQVAAKRLMGSGSEHDLAEQIKRLEEELHSGTLSPEEKKSKMKELMLLMEVQDEERMQSKYAYFQGLSLRKEKDAYNVYVTDLQDAQHKLFWRPAGVEWATNKEGVKQFFEDLPRLDWPRAGEQVTAQQMVRCRKAFGEGFDPAKLVGKYFKVEANTITEREAEKQQKMRYRWVNVKGFRLAYPQAAKIVATAADGNDVSLRTMNELRRMPGQDERSSIMQNLIRDGYVARLDDNGHMRSKNDYYWTAAGIAWALTPPHNRMFNQVPIKVGGKLSDENYDKLEKVFGGEGDSVKAMTESKPPLLQPKEMTDAKKHEWRIVDIWTSTGENKMKHYERYVAGGLPKEGQEYTKDMNAIIIRILARTRDALRTDGWIKPVAKKLASINGSVVMDAAEPDVDISQKEESVKAPSVSSSASKGPKKKVSTTALLNYCGIEENDDGTYNRDQKWDKLPEQEKKDWAAVGYTSDGKTWNAGYPLSMMSDNKITKTRALILWEELGQQPREAEDSRQHAATRLQFDKDSWDAEMQRRGEEAEKTVSLCTPYWETRSSQASQKTIKGPRQQSAMAGRHIGRHDRRNSISSIASESSMFSEPDLQECGESDECNCLEDNGHERKCRGEATCEEDDGVFYCEGE